MKNWSSIEVDFLKSNYQKLTAKKIAEHLGRSVPSVNGKVKQLGLKKGPVPPPRLYKLTDRELLRDLYWSKNLSTMEIAKRLGCGKRTVQMALKRFGIPIRTRYEGIKQYFDRYYEKITPQLKELQYSEEEKKLIALSIDLEGAIVLTKGKIGRMRGYISVSNVKREILDYIHKLAKIGQIGPFTRTVKGNRRAYAAWHVDGFMPMKFLLEQIKDYLIIKKRQAELMIRFCESRMESPRAPYTDEEKEIYKEMRRLNKRGFD